MALEMPVMLFLLFLSFPKSPQKMLTPTSVLQLMSMDELCAPLSWMLLRVGSWNYRFLSRLIDNGCSICALGEVPYLCWLVINKDEILKSFLPFFLLTVGFSMSKEAQKTQVEGEDSNEVNLFKGPVCKNHKTLSKSVFWAAAARWKHNIALCKWNCSLCKYKWMKM